MKLQGREHVTQTPKAWKLRRSKRSGCGVKRPLLFSDLDVTDFEILGCLKITVPAVCGHFLKRVAFVVVGSHRRQRQFLQSCWHHNFWAGWGSEVLLIAFCLPYQGMDMVSHPCSIVHKQQGFCSLFCMRESLGATLLLDKDAQTKLRHQPI